MKYKINQEKYEKVKYPGVEVEIPEETKYFWHNGIRVAYSVKPVWTTWNIEQYSKPEEIWKLDIIMVDPDGRIECTSIQLSNLQGVLDNKQHSYLRLIENILLYPDDNTRTKEQFIADYQAVLDKIKEHL